MLRKLIFMLMVALLAGPAAAQPATTPSLAQPVVEAPIQLTANRAVTWSEGETQYLLLDGEIAFRMGAYAFGGTRAYVRIDREVRPGRVLHHAAVYLEGATAGRDRGAISAEAPRLLVTGTSSGEVTLATNLLDRVEQAPADELVQAAQDRVRRYVAAMARPTLPVPPGELYGPEVEAQRLVRREAIQHEQMARRLRELRETQVQSALEAQRDELVAAQVRLDERTAAREAEERAAAEAGEAPVSVLPQPQIEVVPDPGPLPTVLPATGSVGFTADRIVGQPVNGQSAVMLIGDVKLLYVDDRGETAMTLQAERAVLFLDGDWSDAVASREISAQAVSGVYLEDNVIASDGQYTVRAPRVYYDLARNKAVLLEAVMYTWDERLNVPIYVRADVLRQTSATSFEAEDALLTTSEFAEPHVALGAGRVVVQQQGEGPGSTSFVAYNNTVQVGGVPVFFWPAVAGRTNDLPLRRVSAGYSSDDGPRLLTQWDGFGLVGRTAPEGLDLGVNLDYLGERGPGVGFELDYVQPDLFGDAQAYLVPLDNGEDDLGGDRRDIEHDSDTRGFARWQHRQELRYDLELSLEAAYVSDETFLEEFFREEAIEAKPYETSAYLKKQNENWAVGLLAKSRPNDFTPQLTDLQTPGYQVEKLPEFEYWVTGQSLWDDRLTWYNQTTLSRMRLLLGEDSPWDRGFDNALSQEVFGIPSARTSFEDAFETAGFPTGDTLRLDSRQQIDVPLTLGPINVVPFAVGRLTAYDRDFDEFSDEADDLRLWGQLGVRASTQFYRTYAADSRLLNVNGLRHVIEPSIQATWSDSSVPGDALPVYDFGVENLNEGGSLAFGLSQTLQTLRGGEGYWRNVDWITLDTRYVMAEDDILFTNYPRYYFYRPEFALGGDHFYSELLWAVSDAVGVTGEITYDVDAEQVVQWRVNAQIDHTPKLSSVVGYEDTYILGTRTLSYGIRYQLTTKYAFSVSQTIDLEEEDSRDLGFNIERKLPRWTLNVFGSWDQIEDETLFGVSLTPQGIGRALAPVRIPTRSN